MARRSKKTARTEKLEEPRSFRIKLRPKLSLHIDVADDGERDKAAGNCAGSIPASPPKNDPAKIPTRFGALQRDQASRAWHCGGQ
jgi:hypothetical protein